MDILQYLYNGCDMLVSFFYHFSTLQYQYVKDFFSFDYIFNYQSLVDGWTMYSFQLSLPIIGDIPLLGGIVEDIIGFITGSIAPWLFYPTTYVATFWNPNSISYAEFINATPFYICFLECILKCLIVIIFVKIVKLFI